MISYKHTLLLVTSLLVLLNGSLSIHHSNHRAHTGLEEIEEENHHCEEVITDLVEDIKDEQPIMPENLSGHQEDKLEDTQIDFGAVFLDNIRVAVEECKYYPQSKFFGFAKKLFGKEAANERKCIGPFAKVFLQLYNKKLFPDDNEPEEERTAS